MREETKRYLLHLVGVAALVAVLVHLLVVAYFPSLVMGLVFRRFEKRFKDKVMVHAPPVTDKSRGVVMPSPDLLYTLCIIDLSKGDVKVKAFVPKSYWSFSVYDKATNNVFVVNDRSTKAGWQAWRIVSAQKQGNAKQGVSWVRLPSRRGVALFRTLITDRKQLAHFQSIQKKASCTQAK